MGESSIYVFYIGRCCNVNMRSEKCSIIARIYMSTIYSIYLLMYACVFVCLFMRNSERHLVVDSHELTRARAYARFTVKSCLVPQILYASV